MDLVFGNVKVGVWLKELSLEGNEVGDALWVKISEREHRLEHLNLARNLVGNRGAKAIAENLEGNRYMVCLNLGWNNIQEKGGICIFEALKENESLQILDLSFNPIGNYGSEETAPKKKPRKKDPIPLTVSTSLSQMLSHNTTLRHLDFSNCRFSLSQCLQISSGLSTNHSILGLHMLGNEMNTDPLGFLQKGKGDPAATHILSNVSNVSKIEIGSGSGNLAEKKGKIRGKNRYGVESNWWICEWWQQVRVEIGEKKGVKVEVCFGFEGYVWRRMEYDEEKEVYYLVRMMPQKVNRYYFVVDGSPKYDPNSEWRKSKNKEVPCEYENIIDLSSSSLKPIPIDFFNTLKCHPRPVEHVSPPESPE